MNSLRKHQASYTEERMQRVLKRLGVPLRVEWIPKTGCSKHGEIVSGVLYVYDVDKSEAWLTFQHELCEYKLREVTYVYCVLTNCLIEGLEKLVYERKERFLEFLPEMQEAIAQWRKPKAHFQI